MTCKGCVHYEAHRHFDCFFGFNDSEVEMLCPVFKDKSKYIELPCKVGDKVYAIVDTYQPYIKEYEIGCIIIKGANDFSKELWEDTYGGVIGNFASIGKTVFLTKSEAEQRLKELKENAKID